MGGPGSGPKKYNRFQVPYPAPLPPPLLYPQLNRLSAKINSHKEAGNESDGGHSRPTKRTKILDNSVAALPSRVAHTDHNKATDLASKTSRNEEVNRAKEAADSLVAQALAIAKSVEDVTATPQVPMKRKRPHELAGDVSKDEIPKSARKQQPTQRSSIPNTASNRAGATLPTNQNPASSTTATQAIPRAIVNNPSLLQTVQQQQTHLTKFLEWMARWQSYQHQLAQYWKSTLPSGEARRTSTNAAAASSKGSLWNRRFDELTAYKAAYGDCLVPESYIHEEELPLGKWVVRQRELYADGKLDAGQILQLKSVGFKFESKWSVKNYSGDKEWNKQFDALMRYKDRVGHAKVPLNFPYGETLGQWAARQKKAYEDDTLDSVQHKLLETVAGFEFEPGEPNTFIPPEWRRGYDSLKMYKELMGDVEVTTGYTVTDEAGDLNLEAWLANQRTLHRKKRLTSRQVKLLEALGVDLDARKKFAFAPGGYGTAYWKGSYDCLKEFIKTNGHHEIPEDHVAINTFSKREFKLAGWLHKLRKEFKEGRLTKERAEKLRELGIDLEAKLKKTMAEAKRRRDYWFKCFEELKEFQLDHG